METENIVYSQTLIWKELPGWKPSFSLSINDQVVASLVYPSWFSNKGTAEAMGKRWIIDRKGIFSMAFSVTDSANGIAIGEIRQFVFYPNEIEIFGRAKYKIQNYNFIRTRFGIEDEYKHKLAEFSPYGIGFRDWFKQQSTVRIVAGAEELPDFYMIIALAWYQEIMTRRTAACAAAGS
jgi:hypothetical protein